MPRGSSFDVYLEIGRKRTFAVSLDWPGWCRGGRDEAAALESLLEYAPRYARVLGEGQRDFKAPKAESAFTIVERVAGNPTTDFGAPDMALAADQRPIGAAEAERFSAVLAACWQAFDAAARLAEGKELRKGPRGGGREVEGILEHVLDSERSYLSALGWRPGKSLEPDVRQELARTHQMVLDALAAAVRGELPARGPRGGKLWAPRYAVRRIAWHVLDHAWEIEDRCI